MKWELLDKESAQTSWNQMLAQFTEGNVFQSYEWGEYRKAVSGGQPYRWVARADNGEPIGLFQALLVKRRVGMGVVIGEGGPVGDLAQCLPELQEEIQNSLGLKKCYCRIYLRQQYHAEDALLLSASNWKRILSAPSIGWTMLLDLTQGEDALLAGFSKSWRRNLKRAEKRQLNIQPWIDPDPAELIAIYRRMEDYNDIEETLSDAQIGHLLHAFGDKLILYRCFDQDGTTLSLRGCITTDHHALDMFAVTSAEGRKLYASYALCWAILQANIASGIRSYDLNGINPAINPGAYNFKKGMGATHLEYLGEWDWANTQTLRVSMNILRAQRNRIKEKIQTARGYINR